MTIFAHRGVVWCGKDNTKIYNMKIGVDLGGTNIVAGLVDGQALIRKVKTACPAKGSQEDVIEAIASLKRS